MLTVQGTVQNIIFSQFCNCGFQAPHDDVQHLGNTDDLSKHDPYCKDKNNFIWLIKVTYGSLLGFRNLSTSRIISLLQTLQ